MTRRSALVPAAVVLSALAALIAPSARADDTKMACVRAYEEAQTLRRSGKLRAAREKLEICKSDKCPEALRNDCRPWSREVDEALASVIVAARSKDGRDLTDVRVTVDGVPFATKLDGWAQPIDPGPHTFRFEADGFEPLETPVVAHEGEKRRSVAVVLTPIEKPAPAPPRAPEPREPEHAEPPSRPTPAGAYVLGGIGVVGAGAFGYFALTGMSKKSDLDRCKPYCAQSDVDDARRTFLIGDIALGVGVVSLAAAAYLYLTRSSEEPSTTGVHVEAAPTAHGAAAVVRGSF